MHKPHNTYRSKYLKVAICEYAGCSVMFVLWTSPLFVPWVGVSRKYRDVGRRGGRLIREGSFFIRSGLWGLDACKY